eukprot:6456110-Amphidinium_carterae.1
MMMTMMMMLMMMLMMMMMMICRRPDAAATIGCPKARGFNAQWKDNRLIIAALLQNLPELHTQLSYWLTYWQHI